MKKSIFTLLLVLITTSLIFSQAKKPKIMVVPSDQWCNQNGYITEYESQGTKIKVPDYKTALQESYELNQVISKIGELMAERGFPLVDLGATLKKIDKDNAHVAMMTNKYGASVAESPIDILNRTAKADIILKLSWKVNRTGPKKSVSFNLQGLDAYTSKQVSAASGTGEPSYSAELPVLLEEAVLSHLDNFNNGLQTHFDNLFEQGREGALVVYVWGDAPYDLESEYVFKGKAAELKTIINRYWMPRNCKNGRFSQDEASANVQKFSQVRIPLYGDDGWGGQIAMDFNMFGENLAQFLDDEFAIEAKVVPIGLGQVNLYLGGK